MNAPDSSFRDGDERHDGHCVTPVWSGRAWYRDLGRRRTVASLRFAAVGGRKRIGSASGIVLAQANAAVSSEASCVGRYNERARGRIQSPRWTAHVVARVTNRENRSLSSLPQTSRKPNIAIAIETQPAPAPVLAPAPAARQSQAGGDRGDRPRRPCGSRRAAGRAMPIVDPVATALPAANATMARTGMEAASRVRGFPPRRAARWRSAKLPHPAMLTAPALSGGAGGGRDDALDRGGGIGPGQGRASSDARTGLRAVTICLRGAFERRCSAKFAVLSSVVRYSRWRRGLRGRG